ncbi:MAG: DUF309 domain-containing protein [Cyanosarcina radialis HA8281-LM2]|nr:DUF309 domain-containing protein [Cyanosarcina radialis HA8281-LM2]
MDDRTEKTAFWQGIQQFNQQEFYACHDTLEALWMEASEPIKRFYQGILQIAVACYHLENHNWRGATILLGEGIGKLRDYRPSYEGVDVASLVEQSAILLATLHQTEPERIADLVAIANNGGDTGLQLPEIRLAEAGETSPNI